MDDNNKNKGEISYEENNCKKWLEITFRPLSKDAFFQGSHASSRRVAFGTNVWSINQSELDL